MHWITTREDLIRLVQARTWTMRDALSPDGELDGFPEISNDTIATRRQSLTGR